MKQLPRTVLAALSLTLSVWTGGCGNLLAGGAQVGQALLPISDSQEEAIGAQADQQIRQQDTMDTDPTLNAYVDQVGQKLAAVSDRANIPYHFAVVQSTSINAFSLPGGYVYIDTGALAFMNNEAEMAGVLGHEIGHIVHKDQIAGIRRGLIAQGVTTATLGQNSGLTQLAATIAIQLVMNGYGRTEELNADQAGATEMSRAGYDPNQLIAFFQQLEQKQGDTPAWELPLSDHPSDADRITALTQYIAQNHLTGSTLNAQLFLQNTASLR